MLPTHEIPSQGLLFEVVVYHLELMREAIRARGVQVDESAPASLVPSYLAKKFLKLATALEEGGTVTLDQICSCLQHDLQEEIERDNIKSDWISQALLEKYKGSVWVEV